jgi:hypothetical protein
MTIRVRQRAAMLKASEAKPRLRAILVNASSVAWSEIDRISKVCAVKILGFRRFLAASLLRNVIMVL